MRPKQRGIRANGFAFVDAAEDIAEAILRVLREPHSEAAAGLPFSMIRPTHRPTS